MIYQITLRPPSGHILHHEIRVYKDSEHPNGFQNLVLGSEFLRDPTLPRDAALLRFSQGAFWIHSERPMEMGTIPVTNAQWIPGVPLKIGETRLDLNPVDQALNPQPPFPDGCRPWLTVTREGAQLLWTVRKLAATPLSLYLHGETGTGKEILASLVHHWSPRASGPFVPVHCAALSQSLLESELFGHVKGAFTDAHSARRGALLSAHGGTLFLDEVGDLPAEIQVKLLRFLESGEIRPVGSDTCLRADVRIVCATHQSLESLVREGKFRRDLYFRMASAVVEIPPLRDRQKDLGFLARTFARESKKALSDCATAVLFAHDWPGNVRELRHAIDRASGIAGDDAPVLKSRHFEFRTQASGARPIPLSPAFGNSLRIREMERTLIVRALEVCEGNRTRAAKLLGIGRSTLFEKISRHGLQLKSRQAS